MEYQTGYEETKYRKDMARIDEFMRIPNGEAYVIDQGRYYQVKPNPRYWIPYFKATIGPKVVNFFSVPPKYRDDLTPPKTRPILGSITKLANSAKAVSPKAAKTGFMGYASGLVQVLRSYHRERGWGAKPA